ncbi:hypothetical protein [Brevibacillus sp. H7]|uniref:hypothetical protein n=1 Tax=Brevibacillus sp. H7 TaxID=3349138 RepID=UPI003805E679
MSEICQKCGNIKPAQEEVCRVCNHSDMDEYRAVREYLRSNPNSNAMQIANATGISVSKILRYIKTGSLTVVDSEYSRRQR